MRYATYNADQLPTTVRRLVDGQLDIVDITTGDSVIEPTRIEHGLGRIPRGYLIVSQPYGLTIQHGTDPDYPWTDKYMYIQFSWPGLELTLGIL